MSFLYTGVLFLCRGNAVRSQMAEGFFRSLAPEGVRVWSAGYSPIGVVAETVTVMNEVGVDISAQVSKGMDEIPKEAIDLVITLCGDRDDPCPVFPGKTERLHWPLMDPYLANRTGDDGLDEFRSVRDTIKKRVADLLQQPAGDKSP